MNEWYWLEIAPLRASEAQSLALVVWAHASLMGANYDAASCFCEGGIGQFNVFVLQSRTLTTFRFQVWL